MSKCASSLIPSSHDVGLNRSDILSSCSSLWVARDIKPDDTCLKSEDGNEIIWSTSYDKSKKLLDKKLFSIKEGKRDLIDAERSDGIVFFVDDFNWLVQLRQLTDNRVGEIVGLLKEVPDFRMRLKDGWRLTIQFPDLLPENKLDEIFLHRFLPDEVLPQPFYGA